MILWKRLACRWFGITSIRRDDNVNAKVLFRPTNAKTWRRDRGSPREQDRQDSLVTAAATPTTKDVADWGQCRCSIRRRRRRCFLHQPDWLRGLHAGDREGRGEDDGPCHESGDDPRVQGRGEGDGGGHGKNGGSHDRNGRRHRNGT